MKATKINLSYGTNTIYDDVNFQINHQDKVGIIGVNGAGKTTLFKVLLKEQDLDSGVITMNEGRIGYLAQEIVLEDSSITVLEYLLSGRPIKELETELNEIYATLTFDLTNHEELLKRVSKLQELLEYYDYYEAEAILLGIIADMKIDDNLLDVSLANLSGGQKSKVTFARLLYSNPEILLLDEPTNHLDSTTKDYVLKYLKTYKGTVLIISHDVEFLNKIINKVLHLDKVTHKIICYDGDYDTYLKKHNLEQQLQKQRIMQQEREIKELNDLVKRAKQASRTNHHLKRVGHDRAIKLARKTADLETRPPKYKHLKVAMTLNKESGKIPLEVNKLSFAYPKQVYLFEDLSFIVDRNERFLIVGKNGVGKSTLLKILVGLLKIDKGTVNYNSKTEIAYYAQELELLDKDKTILENVTSSNYSERELRTMLGNFLFYGDDVFKRVKVLSPGEKARVALCKVFLKRANLLILDEPTNHLDPETQKIVASVFKQYSGTIIMVSHNLEFVERIGINRMLVLPKGQIISYSRDLLEHYHKLEVEKQV